jgi:predicted GIY-YIG superfamily endonuclease
MLIGTVYLLHFARPYWGPKRHYVGFTRNLPQRLRAHREGDGRVTTRRAFDQGIGFTLTRVWWPGTLRLERQIKARGPVNYCPLCLRRPRAAERARSFPPPRIGAG